MLSGYWTLVTSNCYRRLISSVTVCKVELSRRWIHKVARPVAIDSCYSGTLINEMPGNREICLLYWGSVQFFNVALAKRTEEYRSFQRGLCYKGVRYIGVPLYYVRCFFLLNYLQITYSWRRDSDGKVCYVLDCPLQHNNNKHFYMNPK